MYSYNRLRPILRSISRTLSNNGINNNLYVLNTTWLESTYTIPHYPVLTNLKECFEELEFNTNSVNKSGYNFHTAMRHQSTRMSTIAILQFTPKNGSQSVTHTIDLMSEWTTNSGNDSAAVARYACPEGNTKNHTIVSYFIL